MNEQNFVEDTQDSTEDIQYQAYVALVEDFKEFIDTTVKAGKDSYKHVDLFNGKPLEESVTHTVPLEDDKAQLLAAACMDLANSTLWLYYHQNKFKDTEFAEVVNNNSEISGPSTAGDEPRGRTVLSAQLVFAGSEDFQRVPVESVRGLQAQGADDLCKHLSARLCCHEVPEKWVFETYHGKCRARLR